MKRCANVVNPHDKKRNRSRVIFATGFNVVSYNGVSVEETVTAPSVTDGVPFRTRGTAVGYHVDLGARLGNFRLLLRYERDDGFSYENAVLTPVRYYRFLVGYSL